MDQILRGIVASNHPENVKKSLIQQFVLKTSNKGAEEDSRAIFEIATEWMTEGRSRFLSETGKLVLTIWAQRQRDAFQKNFTEAFLLSFLAEREQISVNILDYLRTSFDHMQHTSQVFSLYTVVSKKIHEWVQRNTTTDFGAAVARFLIKFEHCWPVGENLLQFNLSLIQALSKTPLPKTSKQEMTSCIQNGAVIGALLNKMWGKNQALVFPVLTEIFRTISVVGSSPSVALASVVQYFSSDVIRHATRLVASNHSVTDENLTLALNHMINWLSWPVGKKVDQWIVGFLSALAFAEKHSILITVTQEKVAQVFSRLFFPVVRESTMVVLSHMLLSFQHSPQAFHEIVEHVPALVKDLKKENSVSSQSTLQTLAELMHCLMYQHTGFPELYGPVLDCLQDLPKPSEMMMKKWLTQSAWSAQCDKLPLVGLTPKSATGKTGLVNLGNTCYMNCVLQALYMLDQFRSVTFQRQTSVSRHPLFYHLQEVFAFLTLSQRAAFAPSKFLHIARPPWFAAGTQQDCSEFLKFLLDRTSEEDKVLNSSNEKPHKTSLVDESFSGKLLVCYRCCHCNSSSCREEVFTDLPLAFPQAEHLEGRSVPNAKHDSIDLTKQPVENADVTVNTTVAPERSLKGGDIAQDLSSTSVKSGDDVDRAATTSSHEAASNLPSRMQEWGLRADVPTDINLTELLEYFFEPETLQGSNQYYCEECQSLQDAERSVAISKSSDFLILTLKRFAYNIRTQQRSKILQCVSYPLILKLPSAHLKGSVMVNNHCSDELVNSEALASYGDAVDPSRFSPKRTKQDSEDFKQAMDISYALCSVIVHSGTSSESGHYYCYARSSAGITSDDHEETTAGSSRVSNNAGTWYLFNDSRVTYSSYVSFADVSKRFPKDTPYVLIYKKVGPCVTAASQESNRPHGQSIRKELVDIVNQDNLLYLQECERQAVNMAKQKSAWSNTYHPPDDDDDDDDNKGPPGSCGSGPGVTMPFNRFVF